MIAMKWIGKAHRCMLCHQDIRLSSARRFATAAFGAHCFYKSCFPKFLCLTIIALNERENGG